MTNNTQQAALEAASADSPFQIQTYPSAEAAAQAAKSKKRKRTPNATAPAPTHSLYHHQKAICALDGKFKSGQDLDMHYTVTPAQQWADAKRYKSFRLNDTSYTSGQFVYVANPDTVETQRKMGVRIPTDEWVAKILEIRAVNEQNVFARVAWMYWPQELPKRTLDRGKYVQGRQPYHGKHELVASNHMDIIHAMSVTEHAKVDQWVESEQDSLLDALYWRQGFDTRTMELSSVSLTCKCKTPANPDNTLIGCTATECGQWLHKECLEDDILTKTWETRVIGASAVKQEEGTNGEKKTEPSAEPSAEPEQFSNGIKKESSSARSTPRRGTSSTPIPTAGALGRTGSVRGRGKKGPAPKPYLGKFEATLRTDDGSARFDMKDLREGVPEAERTWTEAVHCLVCQHTIE
ncbi:hypothetical protein CC79DRAFT_1321349 [Sarocladium strictum]